MKNSTGIVMQLNKKNAFIMTNTGEFLKVKVAKDMPNIGEVYTGEVVRNMPVYKYAATAASLALVLLFGSAAYAYNTPVASMVIDINPSIKLDVNRWDRIIKSVPLNSDGEKVLESLSIKNKQLNDGLNLIIDEAKKDNYINSNYIDSGKIIKLLIEENKLNKQFDLSKFENYVKENKLAVEVKDDKTKNKKAPNEIPSKSENVNIKPNGKDKNTDEIKDNGSSNSENGNDKNNNSGSGNTFTNNGNSNKGGNNASNGNGNGNSNSNSNSNGNGNGNSNSNGNGNGNSNSNGNGNGSYWKDKKDKSDDTKDNNGHYKEKDKENGKGEK